MNISALFIQRPVMTSLVMLGIVIFGVMSYRTLPVSDLPNVDFPTIQVGASLPGASPETMASSVATPLEREFCTIAGIDSMTSTSTLGNTQITVQFSLERNIDAAAQDVQAAIARATNRLPRDMPYPPSYRKVNPADQPVLFLALTSTALPLYTLNEYADTMMAQRISMVNGVAQVVVYGSQKYAVRAQVNPESLAGRGIGIDEVASAITRANVNLPVGVFDGKHQTFTVESTGQLLEAEQYRPLIVAYRKGSPVRLGDLGRVIDSTESNKTAAWFVNERGMVLAIQRQPGTNTVEVVDAVKELLPSFQAQLPASVKINVLYDRSESILASVQDVKFTLWLTLALVVLVIFLFLRNVRATFIPSVAIPMSLVGTFAVMYLLNYSMDNFSLMALTLSVGFVVDDAIVVLENIVRHMEHGKGVRQAAFDGSKEIGFTVISMTISLAAVFIPVLFMGGIIGRLLSEFAVTIGVAILVSGVVSLTLTPMLCSRFLRPPGEERHGHLFAVSENAFNAMLSAYDRMLSWVLRHGLPTVAVSAVVLVATGYLYVMVPKGFLPSEDTGRIFAQTEAPEGISFESMVRHQQAVAEIVRQDPNIESFMSSCGSMGGGRVSSASNLGRMFMKLKPRSQRTVSVDDLIQDLRRKVAIVPGIKVYFQNLPPIQIGGQLTKSQYQYTLQGPDTDELYRAAPMLAERMKELEGFQDVTTDLLLKNPQVNVEIDRDKMSTYGVTAEQIEVALGTAYASTQISTIYAPNNQYQVILEVDEQHQADPNTLPLLYVRSSWGQLVPISALARITRSVGPLSVNHLGQLPAVTVSFNLKPGYSLGPAVAQVEQVAKETLPPTIRTSFQGTAQAFQSSMKGLQALIILSILVIYLVLGILYESYLHPITILTALPFAGFGALVTLRAFNIELSLYAFVGIIMLIGLVKKNGIMMVDFAIQARAEGKTAREAIHQACLVRFRPIMMTTMAALVGTLPIALGLGAGAESRRPLGLAVVGGLLFSQSLTLFATPVFYQYMEAFRERVARRSGKVEPVVAAVPSVGSGAAMQ
jgi:hydrophobic/amphiphilic exporter-1 (mainly G- bacteria), HAE1 family